MRVSHSHEINISRDVGLSLAVRVGRTHAATALLGAGFACRRTSRDVGVCSPGICSYTIDAVRNERDAIAKVQRGIDLVGLKPCQDLL